MDDSTPARNERNAQLDASAREFGRFAAVEHEKLEPAAVTFAVLAKELSHPHCLDPRCKPAVGSRKPKPFLVGLTVPDHVGVARKEEV
eukprot:4036381-Prymnesium_polylepis.2